MSACASRKPVMVAKIWSAGEIVGQPVSYFHLSDCRGGLVQIAISRFIGNLPQARVF
jgi:hypothetical protein